MLEFSKLHMYDFYYNRVCVKYPRARQLRLLFTDTDSLAYAVETDDSYRGMVDDAACRYDFSEYPLDHPLYDTSNRKMNLIQCQCENLLDCVQNAMPFSEWIKWIRMHFNMLDL